MRLFIAIKFNKETIAHITSVQDKLKDDSHGSYTRPENIHLTLVFLGEIPQDRVENIKQAMNQISIPKLNIVFSNIGYFKRNDGDIWWVGLKRNDTLSKLQKDLSSTLIEYGFNIEKRAFKPHITLGRRIRLNKSMDKNSLLDASFKAEVSSISLMKSERIHGRLTYTEIYRCS